MAGARGGSQGDPADISVLSFIQLDGAGPAQIRPKGTLETVRLTSLHTYT